MPRDANDGLTNFEGDIFSYNYRVSLKRSGEKSSKNTQDNLLFRPMQPTQQSQRTSMNSK